MSAAPQAIRHYQAVAAQAARLSLADKLDIVVRSPAAMQEFNEFVGPDMGPLISALLSRPIPTQGTRDYDAMIEMRDTLRAQVDVWGSRRTSTGLVVDAFLSVDEVIA